MKQSTPAINGSTLVQISPTQSMQSVLEVWKSLPHANKPNQLNGDRSVTDQLNFIRALKDLALGIQGEDNLQTLPAAELGEAGDVLQEKLMAGTKLRLGREPERQFASSHRSRLNAFLRDIAPLLQDREMRPKPGRHLWKPYRKLLPRFTRDRWPGGLGQEFEQLIKDCTDPFYAGPGHENLRRFRVRQRSWKAYEGVCARIVEYMVIVEERTAITLIELVDRERLLRVRQWYLNRKERGGYIAFESMCIALAAISRYLVITERLACAYSPFSKDPQAPWIRLYGIGAETRREGEQRGKTDHLQALPEFSPLDMEQLAKDMWRRQPRHSKGKPDAYQIYVWRMAATFYGMAAGAPVRLRNWTHMRWGDNLFRDETGA